MRRPAGLFLGLILGGGVFACSGPENIEVTIESPMTIAQGERFPIAITIRNTAAREQTLVDLDVADEYLKGVAIESSEPPFSGSEHVPIDNTISYSYDLAIPAGAEVAIKLSAYAVHPGDYSGEFDVCINSMANCLYYSRRIIVE